jgi:hypothetical protein
MDDQTRFWIAQQVADTTHTHIYSGYFIIEDGLQGALKNIYDTCVKHLLVQKQIAK